MAADVNWDCHRSPPPEVQTAPNIRSVYRSSKGRGCGQREQQATNDSCPGLCRCVGRSSTLDLEYAFVRQETYRKEIMYKKYKR